MALTYEQLIDKAGDQTLTVREAIDYALSRPVSASSKSRISALISGLPAAGIELDMPYVNLKASDVLEKFNPEFAKDQTNRFGNLSALESVFQSALEASDIPGKRDLYPPLANRGNRADKLGLGGTQRTGQVGESPMRRLIPNAELEAIYDENLPKVADPEVKAALIYHRYTGVRNEHLVGQNAIKMSDFRIGVDEQGNRTVTIQGYGNKTKNRPETIFRGDMAEFLSQHYEKRKANNAQSSAKLFDVSLTKFGDEFNRVIKPSIEEKFIDYVPIRKDPKTKQMKPVTSSTVIRHALPRILKDEFKYPVDLRKAFMGHVEKEIVDRNYAGTGNIAVGEIATTLLQDAAAKTNNSTVAAKFASYGVEIPVTAGTHTPAAPKQFQYSEQPVGEGTLIQSVPASPATQAEIQERSKTAVERLKKEQTLLRGETLQERRKQVTFLQSEEGQEFLRQEAEIAQQEKALKKQIALDIEESAKAPVEDLDPEARAGIDGLIERMRSFKAKPKEPKKSGSRCIRFGRRRNRSRGRVQRRTRRNW